MTATVMHLDEMTFKQKSREVIIDDLTLFGPDKKGGLTERIVEVIEEESDEPLDKRMKKDDESPRKSLKEPEVRTHCKKCNCEGENLELLVTTGDFHSLRSITSFVTSQNKSNTVVNN